MGALHRGHEALIKKASEYQSAIKSNLTLVSIFVNPLQFGPNEDFNNYPRDIKQDTLIAKRCGAKALWAPSLEEIFPGGPHSNFTIKAPDFLQTHLCGASRPGHFDGVATVILRLLNIVRPEILILGEKDWQQFVIIRKLLKDLNMPIKLIGVPTIRDQDGLAYSSRNLKLNLEERKKAIHLPKFLSQSVEEYLKFGELDIENLYLNLKQKGLEIEYLEQVDPFLLKPVKTYKNISLVAASVRFGSTRLIDHKFLMKRKPIVAIDGPAGAGKSTVTKELAKKLNLIYLDTGAMYRAVTWLIKEMNVDIKNEDEVKNSLANLKIEFSSNQLEVQQVHINSKDVTEEIRSPNITALVSEIAAHPSVREILTKQQKEMGDQGGLVAEGRDIGTTVFPGAELKVFLTATASERARRRALDMKRRGFSITSLSDLENEIIKRDELDSSRDISPLIKADDAIEVITDGMEIDQVVEKLIDLFRRKVPYEAWPNPN